jgi:hypothetical protein
MDMDGDGKRDIITCGYDGKMQWFRNHSDSIYSAANKVIYKGNEFGVSQTAMISFAPGKEGALPSIILSENNRFVYKLKTVLKGDIDNDGKVSFYDFMVFANVWGLTENDAGWKPEANLHIDEGVQKIDFYDFMEFVNCWNKKRN